MERIATADDRPSLATLATIRSVIINPNAPTPLLSSLLNAHPTPPLLLTLALVHPTFSPLVVSSLLDASPPLSIPSLSSLRALCPASLAAFGDHFFAGLCLSDDARVRKWAVENFVLFSAVDRRLIAMLLNGLSRDPFPEVRRGALDGLVRFKLLGGFVGDADEIIQGCFWRGVEMLTDADCSVRRAAVRVVNEWGQILVLNKQGEEKKNQSDVVFIQLCSMARDMNVEVRIEAFKSLENLEMVSSDLLLQSLSKRDLNVTKERRTFSQSTEQIIYSPRNIHGALVHGLEDEFYEVRRSVCQSLRKLSTLSSAFAVEAVNYLMDMLNDDEMTVRLLALETMHCMSGHGRLFVPPAHIHMFLGCLNVSSSLIRSAVRKVMKVVKLQNLDFFEASVHGLIKNLETYPQDEYDIMAALFHIGQNHLDFLIYFFSSVSAEIEPTSDGILNFDCARVAALLVLAISAPLSHNYQIGTIPATVFSYAVTHLGKISGALADVDKQMLLVYLSECSRGKNHYFAELREALLLKLAKDDAVYCHGLAKDGTVDAEKARSGTLKVLSQSALEQNGMFVIDAEYQPNKNDDLLNCVKVIFNEVVDVWFLIKSGHRSEAVRTLRIYEEQLVSFVTDDSCGALSFTIQYMQLLKLLAEIWGNYHPSGFHCKQTFGEWEILMAELEKAVGDMRCLFTGFSKEEELHLLELVLIALLLRLSKVEICCRAIFVAKLSHVWVDMERFLEENCVKPTPFLSELKNTLPDSPLYVDNMLATQSLYRKAINSFSPMQFEFSGSLDTIHAGIVVPNNSSENPQIFIQGLPVAIPLDITLHNVPKESRLWLKMKILGKEESGQFVFLDPGLVHRGSNKVSRSSYACSFHRVPKAPCFSLIICLGMERMMMLDDVRVEGSRCWGPKRGLSLLCGEKEVYFSTLTKRN